MMHSRENRTAFYVVAVVLVATLAAGLYGCGGGGTTTIGVGSGVVRPQDSGVDQVPNTTSAVPQQGFGQGCPIIGPQGNIICSCESYYAGRC